MIKCFESISYKILEKEVNDFLNENHIDQYELFFSTCVETENDCCVYSLIIKYER